MKLNTTKSEAWDNDDEKYIISDTCNENVTESDCHHRCSPSSFSRRKCFYLWLRYHVTLSYHN